MGLIQTKQLLAALVYSGVGVAVFGAIFMIVDKLTPVDLVEEILHKQNRALAQVVGSLSIGICIIIAAAILG